MDDIRAEAIAEKRKYLDKVKSEQWQLIEQSGKEGHFSLDEEKYKQEQLFFAYTFDKNDQNSIQLIFTTTYEDNFDLKNGDVYFVLKPELPFKSRKYIGNTYIYYSIPFDRAMHFFAKKHDFDLLYRSLKDSIKDQVNTPFLY